uniref:Uncharacterized protein n=1 Tax=Cucumis melo TaxID=3656 RepID=A0A9I9E6K1_CUCME
MRGNPHPSSKIPSPEKKLSKDEASIISARSEELEIENLEELKEHQTEQEESEILDTLGPDFSKLFVSRIQRILQKGSCKLPSRIGSFHNSLPD